MSCVAEKLDDIEYFELNDLSEETDYPIFSVVKAIEKAVEPVVGDPLSIKKQYPGFKEIVKDVDVHGKIDSPRIIMIRHIGQKVVIDTFNEISDDSEHNGLGNYYIKDIFGKAYTSEVNGNVYHGQLVIQKEPNKETPQLFSRAA